MRIFLSVLVSASLTTALSAQTEWVTNGDFTGTLTPWTMGGAYSVNPGLETGWDTTGLGASDSFGVNAGGQVVPPPYAPNWIEQSILMIQGLTYEIRADASGARPGNPPLGNADIGTIWIEVDNVEVARHAFGNYPGNTTPPPVKRAQLCGRFAPSTTGQVMVRIYFERAYLGGSVNPRMNIDNVSVKDVIGPTYCVVGNRQLGSSVSHTVTGAPGALFGTFAALSEFPAGFMFPGVFGTLFLDPGGDGDDANRDPRRQWREHDDKPAPPRRDAVSAVPDLLPGRHDRLRNSEHRVPLRHRRIAVVAHSERHAVA